MKRTMFRRLVAATGVGLALVPTLADESDRVAAQAGATPPANSPRAEEDGPNADKPGETGRRMREGSVIQNAIGVFRRNGDAASFITEEGIEFGGLPNLNLERVVKLLKSVEEPESVYWSVNGEVTEFSGRNYLLIQRAVFRAAAPPPSPEVIAE